MKVKVWDGGGTAQYLKRDGQDLLCPWAQRDRETLCGSWCPLLDIDDTESHTVEWGCARQPWIADIEEDKP